MEGKKTLFLRYINKDFYELDSDYSLVIMMLSNQYSKETNIVKSIMINTYRLVKRSNGSRKKIQLNLILKSKIRRGMAKFNTEKVGTRWYLF